MAGVKIELKCINEDNDIDKTGSFRIVKETLTRMGIVNKQDKRITPTSYIYYDGSEYFIYHFKELLSMFDKRQDELDEKDMNRRNSICTLLENWGMIEIIDTNVYQEELKEKIFVLSRKDMVEDNYIVNHKFDSFNKLAKLRNNYADD